MPPTTRPQTLKQAKRAYRKSGAAVRLSASELAQAERRASLQERADRIKEREARRKANLKKREEKIARERETARIVGRPFAEDQRAGSMVGASQLSLGDFLGGVKKTDSNQEIKEKLQAYEEKENYETTAVHEEDEPNESMKSMAPPVQPSGQPGVGVSACHAQSIKSPTCFAVRMPPPAKPQSKIFEVLDEAFDECFPSNTQIQRELSPEPCKIVPISTSAALQNPAIPPVQEPTAFAVADPNDLLASISTQDLDFYEALTQTAAAPEATKQEPDFLAQISTQDLDFEDEYADPVTEGEALNQGQLLAQGSTQDLDMFQGSVDIWTEAKTSESEFADDPTDYDLEGLAMEIEKNRAARVSVN